MTLDDRVKSVQRKVYLKKGRFELAPFITLSVNDPYYTKVGTAVRGAFYLADTLALAGRVSLMQVLPEDDVRIAKRTFQSRIFYSVPQWSAMGTWSGARSTARWPSSTPSSTSTPTCWAAWAW